VTGCLSDRTGDDGFQALELAVLFPIVILFALLAVGAGRSFSARNQVRYAAQSGARAGSLVGPAAAAGQASAQAHRSLSEGTDSCSGAQVSTAVRELNGMTFVATTVTCTILVSDLGLKFNQTVSATAEEVVDLENLPR
jgi:Flp pilus assembly protein TadG